MLRVVVIGPENPVYGEKKSSEAITPGHLVETASTGLLKKNTRADATATTMVAVENTIYGKGIDDVWASGELVLYQHLTPGCEFMALVAAAAPAIAVGDILVAVSGGTVAKTATAALARFEAVEAVDNSAGGSAVRLRCKVL
jgi:hypothetical protein